LEDIRGRFLLATDPSFIYTKTGGMWQVVLERDKTSGRALASNPERNAKGDSDDVRKAEQKSINNKCPLPG
jgi:hypothetical protein